MNASPPRIFSWFAFLVAPLPIPLVCSAWLAFGSPGRAAIGFFLLMCGAGLVVSYLGTAAWLVTMVLLQRVRPVGIALGSSLGALLGALAILPIFYLSWQASGPDSGPPTDSFLEHFWRDLHDPITLFFIGAGLITALLYFALRGRSAPPVAREGLSAAKPTHSA